MNKRNKLATMGVIVLSMCGSISTQAAGTHGAHWSYKGHEGPAYWGDLKSEYATCKTGKSQSPINITGAQAGNIPEIKIAYKSSALDVVNNGHSIQVNYAKGSHITIGGKQYELLQFHFHSPSEHKINGKPADMVAHLVHKAADGQLGVIAVMMKKGAVNSEMAKIWAELPTHKGEERRKTSVNIDVAALLPKNKAFYNYSGSLTTPPCSEGVNWMVLKHPVEVSAKQIRAFTDIFPKSVRPVQALHARVIKAN